VGISSIYHVKHVYENGKTIYEDNLNAVDYLMTLDTNIWMTDQVVVRMVKHVGDDTMTDNKAYIENLREKSSKIIEDYEALNLSKLEKKRYKQCKLSIISFNQYVDTVIKYVDEGNVTEASEVYTRELIPVENSVYEFLDATSELASNRASDKNADNRSFYVRTINIIVVTMVIIVAFGVIISLRVSNSYTKKLNKIQEWADRVAKYDMSNDIEIHSNDEFGVTAKSLNDSKFMLKEILSKIKNETETLSQSEEDVGEAIKKVKDRIEAINLTELQYDEDANQLAALIKKTMQLYPLDEEMIKEWNVVLERLDNNLLLADESSKELMSIVTYLEQICVVADYQKKIIEKQKEHTDKFII
jgi:methyl-accepting chemotaxis protein